MKTNRLSFLLALFAFLSSLLLAGSARAQIMGIYNNYTVFGNSYATNYFYDGNSYNASVPGMIHFTDADPWNGTAVVLPLTYDGNTGDSASSSISAAYTTSSYNLYFSNVYLSQNTGITGQTYEDILFGLLFQIGGSVTTLPLTYPGLVVSGDIQTGGSASLSGSLSYMDQTAQTLLATVNYNWSSGGSTGSFIGQPVTTTVTPSSTTTLTLPAGDILAIYGFIGLEVDPGAITVQMIGTPATLTGMHYLANGAFQFSFTNTPSAYFTVLSTTNLALQLSHWTSLGTPVESPAGQYQFTDNTATNSARFYTVVSP